jgi:hypothetical protein
LEPRSSEPLNPVDFEQYVAAVGRAAVDIRSVSFEFVGLAASAGTVMACAHSVDGRANELRHRLQIELGEYGWLENNHFASGRDPIWYATLVNFTGPLENPEHFIDWFSRSRSINLGTAEFGQVELCRWTFQDLRMVPEVIRPIRLGEQSA